MLKQSQLQSMKVSLERGGTTTAAIQRVGTQLTTNNVESGIGGLRSVAGHQAEQGDAMLPIEAMKSSANTVTDVSRQYEHYTHREEVLGLFCDHEAEQKIISRQ